MNNLTNSKYNLKRGTVSLCVSVLSISLFFFSSNAALAQFKQRPINITMACCDTATMRCSGEADLLNWEVKLTSDDEFHQFDDHHANFGIKLHKLNNGSFTESSLDIPTYPLALQDSQYRCTLTDLDPEMSYLSDPVTLTLEPGVGDIAKPIYYYGIIYWDDVYHSFGISGSIEYNLTLTYNDESSPFFNREGIIRSAWLLQGKPDGELVESCRPFKIDITPYGFVEGAGSGDDDSIAHARTASATGEALGQYFEIDGVTLDTDNPAEDIFTVDLSFDTNHGTFYYHCGQQVLVNYGEEPFSKNIPASNLRYNGGAHFDSLTLNIPTGEKNSHYDVQVSVLARNGTEISSFEKNFTIPLISSSVNSMNHAPSSLVDRAITSMVKQSTSATPASITSAAIASIATESITPTIRVTLDSKSTAALMRSISLNTPSPTPFSEGDGHQAAVIAGSVVGAAAVSAIVTAAIVAPILVYSFRKHHRRQTLPDTIRLHNL